MERASAIQAPADTPSFYFTASTGRSYLADTD
jgi:hypothetical protein